MILLYTDFGYQGPYVGEMHAALARQAPGVARVDLMHDAPAFSPLYAGSLLRALMAAMPPRCVVVAVVDPGVGTARRAMVARVGQRWFVGPDNGLLGAVLGGRDTRAWEIPVPGHASVSFHGRDVFAPAAAQLAMGVMPRGAKGFTDWLPGLAAAERRSIIYVDGFGNLVTGLDSGDMAGEGVLTVAGRRIQAGRVFGDSARGDLFWYVNSMGLVEIAANTQSAAHLLGVTVGDEVSPA